ncbi:O-antigen ligase family protein [Paenibacillus sp. SC116]|uniref:O-antigen ligase family protein n=1 Tax=Paenibacillus sp. SC116 TaxID=2968986 RepID=UPI00215AC8B8|nr:O-antigen ligase family protein [Paenibacillus sp. SC116]MCR8842243.1 O-antigen ligase family protein [Paenibacillus sp. SC116]
MSQRSIKDSHELRGTELRNRTISFANRFPRLGWFYPSITILLMLYAGFQQPSLLLVAMLCMGIYIAISSADSNFYLLVFLLPSLSLFVTEQADSSFATMLFLAAFVKHVAARISSMKLHVVGLLSMLGFIMLELLHVYTYLSEWMNPTVRWIALMLYASLLIIDMNFKPSFKRAVYTFTCGILVSSACGLVMSLTSELTSAPFRRFEGVGGDPNGFGMMVLMAAFFLLHLYKQAQKPNTLLVYSSIGLLLLGLTTLSRTYFLTMGFMVLLLLGYMAVTVDRNSRRMRSKIIAAVLILGTVFAIPMMNVIQSIIDRMSIGSSLDKMTGSRSFLAEQYWTLFKDSSLWELLFGRGIIGYLPQSPISVHGQQLGPHNTYLESLVAWGMVGTVVFIAFVWLLAYVQRVKTGTVDLHIETLPAHSRTNPSFLAFLPIISTMIFLLSLHSLGMYTTYFYIVLLIMNLYYTESESVEALEAANNTEPVASERGSGSI